MNSKSGLILLIFIFGGLGGCATMSGDECLTSDWSAIGYEDGAQGHTTERAAKHRKACAKHGVTPDFAAYQDGREQGLLEYCQPNRGFNVGVNGGAYHGVCSVNLEADFLDGYNAGYQLYSLRSDVNRATSAINSKERERERIDDSISVKEAAMISDATTKEERVLLLADLKELSERSGTLEAETKELYEIRARAQVELEHFRVVVADLGY